MSQLYTEQCEKCQKKPRWLTYQWWHSDSPKRWRIGDWSKDDDSEYRHKGECGGLVVEITARQCDKCGSLSPIVKDGDYDTYPEWEGLYATIQCDANSIEFDLCLGCYREFLKEYAPKRPDLKEIERTLEQRAAEVPRP